MVKKLWVNFVNYQIVFFNYILKAGIIMEKYDADELRRRRPLNIFYVAGDWVCFFLISLFG